MGVGVSRNTQEIAFRLKMAQMSNLERFKMCHFKGDKTQGGGGDSKNGGGILKIEAQIFIMFLGHSSRYSIKYL